MLTAKIIQVERLTHMHKEAPGSGKPVIRIVTDLPEGTDNAFYITPADKTGQPLALYSDGSLHLGHDVMIMKIGDEIIFNKSKFLSKVAVWNNRQFKQRGYAFDFYSDKLYTG